LLERELGSPAPVICFKVVRDCSQRSRSQNPPPRNDSVFPLQSFVSIGSITTC